MSIYTNRPSKPLVLSGALLIAACSLVAQVALPVSVPTNPAMPYVGFGPYAGGTFDLTYESTRAPNLLTVAYRLPYASFVAERKPIVGIASTHTPLGFHRPSLTFRVSNSTSRTALFTNVRFTVKESVLDEAPLPVLLVDHRSLRWMRIINEGWGPILNTKVTVGVVSEAACEAAAGASQPEAATGPGRSLRFPQTAEAINLGSISDSAEFTIQPDIVPSEIRQHRVGCAVGLLQYQTLSRQLVSLPFIGAVQLRNPPIKPIARPAVTPSAAYVLKLKTGGPLGEYDVAISQEVPANGSDSFLVEIDSDKTGAFVLDAVAEATDGRRIELGTIRVRYFRPRIESLSSAEQSSRIEEPLPVAAYKATSPYFSRVTTELVSQIRIYPSKEWTLLTASEKARVHRLFEDGYREYLGVPRNAVFHSGINYCYVDQHGMCSRAGIIRVPLPQ
jgi:hypothetical protein